jgi:hypothetical protein
LAIPASPVHRDGPQPAINFRVFLILVVLIISAAILRSAIATRLDGFTLDEPYHIVAGVSYVQRADFRINPEHPPLVKLWVGSIISTLGFHLTPFREIHDKYDERSYTNDNVWTHEANPEALQHHARVAMWIFNGALLFLFTLALHCVFGPIVALGTLLFLAIEPFVAAHLPVVMTDLPLALLGATAVVLASRAFVTWSWPDLAACVAALGLALAAKHSAPIFCFIVALLGLALALALPTKLPRDSRTSRLAKLAVLLLTAVVILWGFYRFRFTESSSPKEVFNRPLTDKISDLHSPAYRFALTHLAAWHLLPRAYIWGLADTARAGLEGRLESRLVWGHAYLQAPWFFFPTIFAVKLPIGLFLLILLGLFLFFGRRLPAGYKIPAVSLLFAAVCFLIVLIRGSAYGGMRHALPVMVLLSIFGGFAVHAALARSAKWLKAMVVITFVGAGISALPALRPWEYFNEFVGGSEKAYLYFSDEGVDCYQRHREIDRYYHQVLEPAGEIPVMEYLPYDQEPAYRHLDWVGRDEARDEPHFQSHIFTGTIMVQARHLGPSLLGDWTALRASQPAARFGGLVVFKGTYDIGPILADDRYFWGLSKLFAVKPDPVAAEQFFRQSVHLYPRAFWSSIELGNIYLARNARSEALAAYTQARDNAPAASNFQQAIIDHLRTVTATTGAVDQLPPLRDPNLE